MDPSNIQTIVLDVDGVLTDGRVTPGEPGDLGKRFNVRDGFAIKQWMRSGGKVAILSGRRSQEVTRRAAELGIELVRQDAQDKGGALRELLGELKVSADRVAYIGDDGPDLVAMEQCGLAATVADGTPAVKKRAHFVTRQRGGEGAVAELIEWLMRKQERWTGRG
jgi:3-deoxy-D-manno-octulosonate 8-phosphate phosphatase (KDO 8-P phosphatase)